MASVSVVVPTYKRPADLRRCLEALERQILAPEHVIVTVRDSDDETVSFLETWRFDLPLEILTLTESGQVAALNAALRNVTTDIVAITDDDAAPRREWLQSIHDHFVEDPSVGAVGGRDIVDRCPDEPNRMVVGQLQWFGRTVGNHHLGTGPARFVDFLKGANMAYRCSALGGLRFDHRLRGAGAQVHNDLAFSLAIRRRGWKVVYDPSVIVDHYPGMRFDEDSRQSRSLRAVADAAFNESITVLEHLPWYRHPAYWFWSVAVGTRDKPGLAQCFRPKPLGRHLWREVVTVIQSKVSAAGLFYIKRRS